MKKINLLFIAILVIALGLFNSCDKDEEIDYEPELLGTWVTEKTIEEIINVSVFTFNKDLTGQHYLYEKGDTVEMIEPIAYFVDDNSISIILLGCDNTISGSYSLSLHTGASFERLHLTFDGETFIYNRLHLGGYN